MQWKSRIGGERRERERENTRKSVRSQFTVNVLYVLDKKRHPPSFDIHMLKSTKRVAHFDCDGLSFEPVNSKKKKRK